MCEFNTRRRGQTPRRKRRWNSPDRSSSDGSSCTTLPTGFTRIRHYGFLGNGARRQRLSVIRTLSDRPILKTPRRVPTNAWNNTAAYSSAPVPFAKPESCCRSNRCHVCTILPDKRSFPHPDFSQSGPAGTRGHRRVQNPGTGRSGPKTAQMEVGTGYLFILHLALVTPGWHA